MSLLARVPPSSDFACWHQVIGEEQYKPLVELSDEPKDVKTILDLGANVGYASYYFSKSFPDAQIYALEPSGDNIMIMCLNLDPGGNVSIREGGIWSSNAMLSMMSGFRDGKEWSHQLVEDEGGDIQGFTVDDMCSEEIDILKIDVEGAEFEMFKKPDFLKRTKVLGVEIHHECGDADMIHDTLRKYGFTFYNHGEILVASNEKY